jgi:hypothetical protein
MSEMEIFWGRVDQSGDCWLWTAGLYNNTGYGQFRRRGAHRVAYEALIGPIPKGLEIDHLCRVRHCVNPAHMELVTKVENVMRGESPAARNARKAECHNGHVFTSENTYIDKRGRRSCRECGRAAWRAWRVRTLRGGMR